MTVIIIVFSISLVLILGLISYQFILVRKNQLKTLDHAPWIDHILPTEYEIIATKQTVTWYSKRYGHLLVLLLLKLWIKASYYLRRKKGIWLPKIKQFIFRYKIEGQKTGPVSNFLKSISDYKNKLKDISREIKEKEKIENQ